MQRLSLNVELLNSSHVFKSLAAQSEKIKKKWSPKRLKKRLK